MSLEGTNIEADEEFGFVSRDPKLLNRADGDTGGTEITGEGNKEGEEEEGDKFRSPPDSEEAKGVTSNSGDGNKQQQVDPLVSKRGSMASVGSSSKHSDTSEDKAPAVKSKATKTEVILPQAFQVKYLGRRDARGLWGIKHTRRPVDAMVAAAKSAAQSTTGIVLPVVRLTVSSEGVTISETPKGKDKSGSTMIAFHAIDSISYGVQDLVYTRVFSMIVVRESAELKGQHPFECHAFVCDSRAHARKLTYALAAAFHEYSRAVRASSGGSLEGAGKKAKKFAIDLRTPEQIEKDLQTPQEADSEA